MKIDLNNYEERMMDYLDGNLDVHQSNEMEAFLLKHSHIAEELEDLKLVHLKKDQTDSIDPTLKTNLLFKDSENINSKNFENYFIAYYENDIEESEQNELKGFLSKNPFLKKDFKDFELVRLQADTSIQFPHKNKLIKKENKSIPFWLWSGIAAAILAIGFWIILPEKQTREIYAPRQITPKSIQTILIAKSRIEIPKKEIKMTPVEFQEESLFKRKPSPNLISSLNVEKIIPEDKSWQIQMELMQSYAFERNQLNTQVNWAALPSENSKKGFRMISSFLWKTTKAQVQSFGEEVFNDDLQAISSSNIENLTGGFISVKKPTREKE